MPPDGRCTTHRACPTLPLQRADPGFLSTLPATPTTWWASFKIAAKSPILRASARRCRDAAGASRKMVPQLAKRWLMEIQQHLSAVRRARPKPSAHRNAVPPPSPAPARPCRSIACGRMESVSPVVAAPAVFPAVLAFCRTLAKHPGHALWISIRRASSPCRARVTCRSSRSLSTWPWGRCARHGAPCASSVARRAVSRPGLVSLYWSTQFLGKVSRWKETCSRWHLGRSSWQKLQPALSWRKMVS
mmetsp:Transcript_119494/g.283690  ORF Transcript_119494/g.283690 Transcript_119494/m.283690 type:complete len:246 (-) Transcript_119494:1090-1827(-)